MRQVLGMSGNGVTAEADTHRFPAFVAFFGGRSMVKANSDYLKLPGTYLFSTIAKKVKAFQEEHPQADLIRLGIGDVTQPLCPAVTEAMHRAVDEMGQAATFRGYAPDLGYDFLRRAMAQKDYRDKGCDIADDEIFISDGAKCDSGNIQEIFSGDSRIAVCDPVYPVYIDSNVMAGRTGAYDAASGTFRNVIYLPCTAENDFAPELPEEVPDLIYLCSPNNPTGAVMNHQQLQTWVDYARANGSVILFDAAYEAYITQEGVPHTIYECEGARECAIELRSFSKNAGFTGVRLGAVVLPHDLKAKAVTDEGEKTVELHSLWARRHGTKFNGTAYIVQRAGEAVYSEEGQQQTRAQVEYYMRNASCILEGLSQAGYAVYGGKNAPYIWLRTENGMTSWEFFDDLLSRAGVIGTPGSGFGPHGESYFRLTAFGSYENTKEAVERLVRLKTAR